MIFRLTLLVSFLSVTSLFAQTTQPTEPMPRISFDGVPLPDAITNFPLGPDVPLVMQRLGSLPEKCVPKLYNVQKSRDVLQKRTKIEEAFDWFGWDVGKASICGMRLTDGRVTGIALIFNSMGDSNFERINREIRAFYVAQQKKGEKVPAILVRLVRRNEGGALFIAVIRPTEWYVLTREPRPEIREAMRGGRPVIGMTTEELLLTLGKPSTQSESTNGDARYIWSPQRHQRSNPENSRAQGAGQKRQQCGGERKHRQDDEHASSLGVGVSARG